MQTNRNTKIATQFRGLHGMSAVAEFPSLATAKTSKAKSSKLVAKPKSPVAVKDKFR